MSHDEVLDIVDENDNVLYQATKKECYQNKLRKRIVNIAIIDPDTQKIAIQTRGKDVPWQPGYYCLSACGHVVTGESWEQGAARELLEEMGIESPLNFIDKIMFTDETGHPFVLGVFTAQYPHRKLKADPREVDQVFFMDRNEIRELISKGEKLNNLFLPVLNRILETE